MSKEITSIVLSVKPIHCRNILSGKKTIELRKRKPAVDPPFRVYMYMTGYGVVAEYICDEVYEYEAEFYDNDIYYQDIRQVNYIDDDISYTIVATNEAENPNDYEFCQRTCLSFDEIKEYVGVELKRFFGWNISKLQLYTAPKRLSDFGIGRAPQSYQYIKT